MRKIIELIVDDDQDPPHKDTIIASLETFDLEIFDWKKLDLCSDTIFKAAPHANKIVLYSSGNNAVLKSWSATDGLVRFQRASTSMKNVMDGILMVAEPCLAHRGSCICSPGRISSPR